VESITDKLSVERPFVKRAILVLRFFFGAAFPLILTFSRFEKATIPLLSSVAERLWIVASYEVAGSVPNDPAS
jgi:hypothetical protein